MGVKSASSMDLALEYASSGSLIIKHIFAVSLKNIKSDSIFSTEWHSAFLMSVYWEHHVIKCSPVSGSLRTIKWQSLCSGVKAGLSESPFTLFTLLVWFEGLLCKHTLHHMFDKYWVVEWADITPHVQEVRDIVWVDITTHVQEVRDIVWADITPHV